MRSPQWWIRRLSAMSPAEVIFRALRVARYPVERLRIAAGLYARAPASLSSWRGPALFYFTDQFRDHPCPAAVISEARAICSGQRSVLGLGTLRLPADPWHFEPSVGAYWPKKTGARVLLSAPPTFDARLTWEINRGHEWVVLARAFFATDDRAYLARLEEELASWRRTNPIGIGINWSSAMEAAIRIHSFAWIAAFLRQRAPETLALLGRLIHEHAMFVSRNLSSHSSANNHLLVELTGLVIAARSLDSGDQEVDALIHRLESELARQVYPDGVNAEMATHYHAFVLEAVALVALVERAHGRTRPILTRIALAMGRYLKSLTCANASVLQQGDSDDGKILPLFGTQHTARVLGMCEALASTDSGEPVWLDAKTAAALSPSTSVFADSGQVVIRTQRVLVSFDAGPFGLGSLAAHAHCDALAVNAAVDGTPLLVDRGTFRYNGSPRERNRFRLTAAHNTIQIEDAEQARPGGPFLWITRPTATLATRTVDALSIYQGSHDGYRPYTHQRSLLHVRDAIVLVDTFAGGTCRATSRYHLAPPWHVREQRVANGSLFTLTSDRAEHAWLWASVPGHVVQTDHSDEYARIQPARTVECECQLDDTSVLVTAFGCGQAHESIDALRTMVEDLPDEVHAPILRRILRSFVRAAEELGA
jgi:uncharacterized heparinase superfamily protein